MTKEFQDRLNQIQVSLNAKKSKTNSFGGYKYRSCEDITEALKPHLKSTGCVLTMEDDIVMVGDRIYVKATATLHYKDESISTTAFAREPLSKKGTDESQVTGAASSYSRKYALAGLLAIDDGVDADLTNHHGKDSSEDAVKELAKCKTKEELLEVWKAHASEYGNDQDFRTAYMKQLNVITNANKQ